jgi:hypothetical protein
MIKIQNKIDPTTSATGRFGHLYLDFVASGLTAG